MMNIDEMPAGPEMDRLVAEKVMKWHKHPVHEYYYQWFANDDGTCVTGWCDPTYDVRPFRPSGSIVAAWEVVEKLSAVGQNDVSIEIISGTPIVHICSLHDCYTAEADTVSLAICRAALKAVT